MTTAAPNWLESTAVEARMPTVVQRVGEVCPLPATVQRILTLVSGERPTVPELTVVIATDPALAAEVLRIANSSAFGRSRKVTDLHQAVTTIGLANLRHMASAMAMLAAFASNKELSPQLHRSSVLSGTLARGMAAKVAGVDGRSAFLAGLLCEIGAMACLAVDADGYDALWAASGRAGENRLQLERARYGATTMQIGGQLLFRNQLSADVALAVEAAPDGDVADAAPLQRVVMFARAAAPLLVLAANEDDPAILSEEIPRLAERLGLTVAAGDLIALCLEAAEGAELVLPGQLGPTNQPTESKPDSAEPVDPAAAPTPAQTVAPAASAEPIARRRARPQPQPAATTRWVLPLIVTAAVVVAGTAAMLLLR